MCTIVTHSKGFNGLNVVASSPHVKICLLFRDNVSSFVWKIPEPITSHPGSPEVLTVRAYSSQMPGTMTPETRFGVSAERCPQLIVLRSNLISTVISQRRKNLWLQATHLKQKSCGLHFQCRAPTCREFRLPSFALHESRTRIRDMNNYFTSTYLY
jgi:hypothetical protein